MAELSWIGIYVRSNNIGLLTAVYNMAPGRFDSRLWDSDQYILHQDKEEDGTKYVSISLFFIDRTELESFKGALFGITGFLNACLPGSYIKTSKCWHHELLPNGAPVRPDDLEYEEVIV